MLRFRTNLRTGLVFASLNLLALSASAQIRLTDACVSGVNANGDFINLYGWDTTPGNAYELWMISGSDPNGSFINGPTDSQASINLPLTPGVHVFSFLTQPNLPDISYYAINLSFNGGSSVTDISGYAPVQTTSTSDPALTVLPSGKPTLLDGDFLGPSSGTLSYTSNGYTVTLTDFRYAVRTLFNIDRVSPYNIGANGSIDNVGQFTVLVTAVPEPGSVSLLLATSALIGAGFLARRKNARVAA